MKLIETKTVTTAGPSLAFSAVPQTFTDLVLLMSTRGTGGVTTQLSVTLSFNGTGGTGSSNRYLIGNGSSLLTGTLGNEIVWSNPASSTAANTFSNSSVYIANYTSATVKSISADAAFENNTTTAGLGLTAMLWNNTAAITSIELASSGGINFAVGTTFSLYGIGGVGDGYAAPKATGGTISYTPGYVVHTFTASGTFTPTANLTDVEYLVIAGGGGTSIGGSGGGGGGGYRSSVTGESSGGGASAESKLSLTSGVGYTVTVGAGGSAGSTGTAGSNSVFSTITCTGGGRGVNGPGGPGGSGGGAGYDNTGGAGTANQGFAGGNSVVNKRAAGGGGAGGAGQNGVSTGVDPGAAGGVGVTSSITGTTVGRAGGGGGQGATILTIATDGGGGGGPSNNAFPGVSGTVNTGGGGGSGNANGGSGIVIVRYAA